MGMADDVLDDLRKRISRTLDDLRRELAKVRTGRANPALLEGVRVDYYGQMSPLNNVSNVTVADPRLIVIKPWEKSMIPVIEKAIRNERRDAKELIEEAVKEGELTEDDGKKAMEKLQTEVDNGVKKVDEVIASKEKDLMQV